MSARQLRLFISLYLLCTVVTVIEYFVGRNGNEEKRTESFF